MFPSTFSLLLVLLVLLVHLSITTPVPQLQPSSLSCPTYYERLCCRDSFPQLIPKNSFWGYMCRDPNGGGCLPTLEEALCCPPHYLEYCIKLGSPALEY